MSQNGLIIFIRNPEQGKVKSRLAKDVGEERALEIYFDLLDHTRKVSLKFPGKKWVYYSEFVDQNDKWDPKEFFKSAQTGNDLGQRIQHAFQQTLSNCDKAIIIGSDCPVLSNDHFERALTTLDDHDVVIGPSADGGYYLLGLKKPAPELFENISWGSSQVLSQTIEAIQKNEYSWLALEELNDIDTLSDWETYLSMGKNGFKSI